MINYPHISKFRLKIINILSGQDSDEIIYSRMFETIAQETGVDIVMGLQILAHGKSRIALYPPSADIDAIPEFKRAAQASFIPFDRDNLPVSDSPHSGFFYVMEENVEHAVPLYLIALYQRDRELDQSTRDTFREMIRIIPPLFRLREERLKAKENWDRSERSRRENESELRRLFEESRDMIYTTNADDVFASINQAGINLLGASNRFELIGRRFADFVMNEEDRGYFLKRIKESGFIQDYEIILKDSRFCIETAHTIHHADGSFAGIQGIIKDITDRINNERSLWLANMELAEANEQLKKTQVALLQQEKLASIGQLAAGVAHEINNPLGFLKSNWESLRLYTDALVRSWNAAVPHIPEEILRKIKNDEDLDFMLKEIPSMFAESADGFNRIIEIVSQLKAFSRIDKEGSFAPYELERGINSTLIVANNEIKYYTDVEKKYGGVQAIMADGGAINQVLLNLIVNAAQAIASTGRKERGHILITTRTEGNGVSCTIQDDGPGFDDKVKAKVFDPFFTTKEPGKGTGLGLSISWDIIVTKHHGTFTVRSTPGKGSEFTFWLPQLQE